MERIKRVAQGVARILRRRAAVQTDRNDTAYLLASEKNAAVLREAIAASRAGKGVPATVDELRREFAGDGSTGR